MAVCKGGDVRRGGEGEEGRGRGEEATYSKVGLTKFIFLCPACRGITKSLEDHGVEPSQNKIKP